MTRLTHERIGVLFSDAPAYKEYAMSSMLSDTIRIQNIEYSFINQSVDVKAVGSDKFISRGLQSPVTRSPDVSFSMNYFFAEGKNEIASNLYIGKNYSLFRNFFDFEAKDDINIFVVASNLDKHTDLSSIISESSFNDYTVIGIGNAFMTEWNYSASVGNFPSCRMNFLGSSINFSEYDMNNRPKYPSIKLGKNNQNSPEELILRPSFIGDSGHDLEGIGRVFDEHMDPEISTVMPGDVEVDIEKISGEQGGSKIDSIHAAIQSISITVPVERQSVYGLGSNYVFDRKLQLPITGSINMSLVLREFEYNGVDDFFGQSNVYKMIIRNKVGLRVLGNQGQDYVIDNFYYVAVFDDTWRRVPFYRLIREEVGVPGQWTLSEDQNYFYVCAGGYEWGRIPLVDSDKTQLLFSSYGFTSPNFIYESDFVNVHIGSGNYKKFAVAEVDLTSKQIQDTLNVSQGMNFDISRAQLKRQVQKHAVNNNSMIDVEFSFDISQEDGLRLYFK